jgi:hypothetical protein
MTAHKYVQGNFEVTNQDVSLSATGSSNSGNPLVAPVMMRELSAPLLRLQEESPSEERPKGLCFVQYSLQLLADSM